MGPTGRLVTIKRSGVDGPHFPLSLSTCLFGRGIECDIRIQLPVVSRQHCKIEISGQKATLFNFSATNPTQVNGSVIDEPVQLRHGDLITIVDRSFRYENEGHQKGGKTTEFPGQRREQASPRRGPRSDFSSDPARRPEGDVEDPNGRSEAAEGGVSGPGPAGRVGAARGPPRASGEPVARRTPDVPSSALPGDGGRHAAGPPAGEGRDDARVTSASGSGEPTRPSARGLERCGAKESPFRQLYECLKGELDAKLEKESALQDRRKSGARGHRTTDNGGAGGSQVSPKPGRRSGPRPQSEAGSASGDRGRGRSEAGRSDAGPAHTPGGAVGPRAAPRELTKGESLAPCPLQNPRPGPGGDRTRGGDSVSPGPRVGLEAGGGPSAPERIVTRTQTQTAPRDDGVDKFGNTPEKALPKKRRSSVAPHADLLAVDAETPAQAPLSPLRAQVERKVPDGPLSAPEPLGAGPAGLRSADVSNFAEAVHKMEGVPSKRRRVSFGGHLRPELFDENLPPNTPLKRGETPTKGRSLGTHTPAVLKKIIKEQPPPSGKDDASEIRSGTPAQSAPPSLPAAAHTHGARPPPSGPPCAQGADPPRSGARRSSGRPPRPSAGRSQLELLQAIHSKRRSGASEANLMVAKSWADVVRLSARQAQTKVAKRGAQRPPSKRPRRSATPKAQKPVGSVQHPSSTGHANSPCTIVIGKAHLEKVSAPARPCRMLNSFVFGRKVDFKEDLSGLADMFKTPAKEKLHVPSVRPATFPKSEDLLRKTFAVPNAEEETLLRTTKNSGETVFSGARNAPGEPSDETSASPAFRQQRLIVNGDVGRARPGAEPPRAASGADELGRSTELGNTQTPGAAGGPEVTDAGPVEDAWRRRLGKTPLRRQKAEGELTESERPSGKWRKNDRSEEHSEKTAAARRSRASELRRAVRPEDPVALGGPQDADPEGARDSHGPLRSPGRAEEPRGTESKTTTVGSESLDPEPFGTPAKGNVWAQTPSQKASVEVLSAHRKRPRAPGEATHTRGDPEGDEKDVEASLGTPEQKRNPAENAAGSRRRSRMPKRKVQALQDLAGFGELFQTPKPTVEPVTGDQTNNVPSRSPQVDPVITSTVMTKGLKTLLQKVDVEQALSALRKSPRAPGGTMSAPREPAGDEKAIEFFQATLEQKLDTAENAAGSRRRPRTPKRKVQALEDLAGFGELFQTPDHTLGPVTDDKTNNVPCRSPQAEPVTMPTGRRSRLKTSLGKVDTEEDISAPRNPTPTPAETTQSHGEAGGDDKDIKDLRPTPEQKLDPIENAAGSKRKPRTPKRKVQALQDLAGFGELFQTPKSTVEPVTSEQTNNVPSRSPQVDPVITSTVMTKGLKTLLQKVDVEEALSALRKSPRAPGGTMSAPREPAGDEKAIEFFQATPEQKLELTENATGSRRRPRTPKRKVQALEDLAGFRELFQTPDHTLGPVTDDKTNNVPCRSPKPEPINTSRKSRLKTPLGKVDVEGELSAPREPTATPGAATGLHGESGDGKEIRVFKATLEQKLDPIENAAGSKRRPRTPKRKVQALQDLAGFGELFQTPKPPVGPVTGDQTNNVPSRSPQVDPVITSTVMTKGLKTLLQKVDVEEALSALRKSPRAPGGTTGSPRELGDEKAIEFFQATLEQKLELTENAAGSRRPRTPKRKVQALEDLAGFGELFQTPKSTVEPVTNDKTNNIPSRSPKPEPINTSRKSRLKTPLGKVDVEGELSALREPTATPGETTQSHGEAGGDDKDIKDLRPTPEQKLDPIENAAGSKRKPRTPKRKVQALQDLASFGELFQTPKPTVEPVTGDQTNNVPSRSPQAEPVTMPTGRRSRLKTSLGEVDTEEDISAPRNPTATPGETTQSHGEAGGDNKDIKDLRPTPEQKLNPAESAAGSRRRPRTPKRKVQALQDLAGFGELFLTPKPTVEPVTGDQTNNVPSRSPQAEPVTMPTGRRSRLKTSLGKVDTEEDISAPRNSTPTPAETTQSHGEAGGDDKDIKDLRPTPEQKLGPIENAAGSKRKPRTPKRKVQALEDLAGFGELFLTPKPTVEPVTGDQTNNVPSRSPQAEPVTMPTGRRSRLKTSLGKVDTEEDISAPRNSTPTPAETTQSHGEAGGDDKDIKDLRPTPEQKLNPAESAAGSKRKPRTPKRKVQALQDLAGFGELFQTPKSTVEPVTSEQTNNVPSRSPQVDPVITSTVMTKGLKTLLQKVDVEEALLALRKSPRAPGGTTGSPRELGDEKAIEFFQATLEQKLELTENAAGSRRPRTPKRKVQALEDLAGFGELFQTPKSTVEPVTDDKTNNIPSRSPKPEPINTSRKSRLKTPLGKVAVEGELSAPREPTATPGAATLLHRQPGDGKDVGAFTATPELKPELAEIVTGSKKRPRTAKGKVPAPEDLAGIEELFRTPDHTVAPVTDDKARIPSRSAQAEPAGRKKRLKAPPGQADVEVEPSALQRPTRTSRKTRRSPREPQGDGEDVELCQKTSEREAGSAETVTRSKRRPRAPEETARAAGDLAGLEEPSPASDRADGQSAGTLRPSPPPDLGVLAASKRRRREAPAGEEEAGEPAAAPAKPTRMPGTATRSRRAPGGGSAHPSLSRGAEGQRPGPAENAAGSGRRLRPRAGQPSPPDDRPGGHEPDGAPGSDAESAPSEPAPTRGRRKPAPPSRSVPRALLCVEPTGDPAGSQNESVPRSPARRRGGDEKPAGAERPRPRARAPAAGEDLLLRKRPRTRTAGEHCPAPGPAVSETARQGLSAERTDLPGSAVSAENTRRKVEDAAPPEKGVSLRSRRPNKADGAGRGPGITSAERAPTRRNGKKTPDAPQETTPQAVDDGAEDPAPGGQARGGGARLRPGRQRRAPSGAAGDAGESRAGLRGDARGEEEGAKRPGRGCSRPRKVAAPPAGDTSEKEPERRVTRSTKRSAENLTKENDEACIRKMRTRSRRDSEDV